jgi:iron complex transport system permease protein
LTASGWLLHIGLVGSSIAGAVLVLLLILWVSRAFADPATVLVTGLMVTFFTSALVSVLLQYSNQAQLQRYVMWGMGSLGGVDHLMVQWLMLFAIITAFAIWLFSRKLDLLMIGDDQAKLSGLNPINVRMWLIVLCGLLVASITAYVGPIGFIGIAVPHLVRTTGVQGLHRAWIPLCVLIGASLMMLSGVLSRYPVQLPLNAVTAIIGAPVVVWILVAQRKKEGVWK